MGFKPRKNFYMMPQAALEADFLHDRPATVFEARIYIASKANRKPAQVPIGNRTIHLKEGEFITSQEKLAAKFNWDRKKVRDFLRREADADHVVFVTKRGKKSGYTRITIKDIWDLDADLNGEKWSNDGGEVNRIPHLLPHRPDGRDVSSLAGNNSYVGRSGSENGFVSGCEDGILKSAHAEVEPIDGQEIDYWDFCSSIAEAAALSKLSQTELRQVAADVKAGQSVAVAVVNVKSGLTAKIDSGVDVVKKANDG
jgi:hypothetical protein